MISERDVGFRVRVVGRSDQFNGREGVLLGLPEGCGDRRWPVRLDGYNSRHGRVWIMPDELERVGALQTGTEEGAKR